MEIRIKLDSTEVQDIIKKYISKEFPIDLDGKEVYITESYGSFTVEITEKVESTKDENETETEAL